MSDSRNSCMPLIWVCNMHNKECTYSLSITRQVTASAAITFAVLTSSLYEKRERYWSKNNLYYQTKVFLVIHSGSLVNYVYSYHLSTCRFKLCSSFTFLCSQEPPCSCHAAHKFHSYNSAVIIFKRKVSLTEVKRFYIIIPYALWGITKVIGPW